MRNYFYVTLLIGAILLGIITIVSGKRYTKTWRNIQVGFGVIIVVALIGFIVTLM